MKLALFLALAMLSYSAYAACTYHTFTDRNGNTVRCTTCCFGNNCNTTCN